MIVLKNTPEASSLRGVDVYFDVFQVHNTLWQSAEFNIQPMASSTKRGQPAREAAESAVAINYWRRQKQ